MMLRFAFLALVLVGCADVTCGDMRMIEGDSCVCLPGMIEVEMRCVPLDAGIDATIDGFVSDGCVPSDEVCDGEDNDCDGVVDGAAATLTCEPLAGARETVCAMGICTPLCEPDRGDCNDDVSDGCEADLLSDLMHCGGCNSPCGWSCVEGVCEDATQIEAGNAATCARLETGRLACWGRNFNGELGIGSTTDQDTPIFLALENVEQVALGAEHTCARLADGTARCWGRNGDGRLGNGSRAPSLDPVVVRGPAGLSELTGITDIACGDLHSCAVIDTGRVRCWGGNVVGQLGDGTMADRVDSAVVSDLLDASAITAGESHTCAIHGSDDRVSCWGNGFRGQLGQGSDDDSSTPVAVLGVGGAGLLRGVAEISAGVTHTCALLDSGLVACWGHNVVGQLGTGSMTGTTSPVLVASVSDVTAIGLGNVHSCAIADESVCWGNGDSGRLGTGDVARELSPAAIDGPAFVTVEGGAAHTCALTDFGAPFCWGSGGSGRLGSGTEEDQLRPFAVVPPTR